MIPEREGIQTGEAVLDRIQDTVDGWIFRLGDDVPILNGRLIEDQSLSGSSADNLIEHKLNRSYRGYIVVKNTGNAAIYDDTANNGDDDEKYINLKTTTAQTVSLWVF
jgi:hypothetical protein